jgi:hypothetical protein
MVPQIDKTLLDYLEKLYPDKYPNLDTPDKEVWFKAGQVSVLRFLKNKFEEQNENILKG